MIGYSLIQSRLVDSVKKSLLDERQELLDYKFSGTMTARQDERLEVVRFYLDVIEEEGRQRRIRELRGKYKNQLTEPVDFAAMKETKEPETVEESTLLDAIKASQAFILPQVETMQLVNSLAKVQHDRRNTN